MKKIFAIICLVLAVATMGYWYLEGHHMWTLTQVPEEVTVRDEVFDTTTTTIVWKDKTQLGLDWLGSIAGGLVLISGTLYLLHRRARSRADQGKTAS